MDKASTRDTGRLKCCRKVRHTAKTRTCCVVVVVVTTSEETRASVGIIVTSKASACVGIAKAWPVSTTVPYRALVCVLLVCMDVRREMNR